MKNTITLLFMCTINMASAAAQKTLATKQIEEKVKQLTGTGRIPLITVSGPYNELVASARAALNYARNGRGNQNKERKEFTIKEYSGLAQKEVFLSLYYEKGEGKVYLKNNNEKPQDIKRDKNKDLYDEIQKTIASNIYTADERISNVLRQDFLEKFKSEATIRMVRYQENDIKFSDYTYRGETFSLPSPS